MFGGMIDGRRMFGGPLSGRRRKAALAAIMVAVLTLLGSFLSSATLASAQDAPAAAPVAIQASIVEQARTDLEKWKADISAIAKQVEAGGSDDVQSGGPEGTRRYHCSRCCCRQHQAADPSRPDQDASRRAWCCPGGRTAARSEHGDGGALPADGGARRGECHCRRGGEHCHQRRADFQQHNGSSSGAFCRDPVQAHRSLFPDAGRRLFRLRERADQSQQRLQQLGGFRLELQTPADVRGGDAVDHGGAVVSGGRLPLFRQPHGKAGLYRRAFLSAAAFGGLLVNHGAVAVALPVSGDLGVFPR